MLLLLISSIVLCAVCQAMPNASFTWTQMREESRELEEVWSTFKKDHGKSYLSAEEEMTRKVIFAENLKKIETHNYLYAKGLSSFTMGVNHFADMTVEEFSKTMNTLKLTLTQEMKKSSNFNKTLTKVKDDLPESVDWRMKGFVTPVKNQGYCGSCWSFSTTGALEGQIFRRTGSLISLSEQNLVDCSGSYGNHGCNGGLMDLAYRYIIDNGINTEAVYPYEGQDLKCRFNKKAIAATMTTYVDLVPTGDEEKIKQAVATEGPIAVAIDASLETFQLYRSGVFDDSSCSSEFLNHAVLVVGYGTYDDKDYWMVKNSWSPNWGDKGYILMSRNRDNQCGIANYASFPL